MVARDHSCDAPFCIRTEGTKVCDGCTAWLCPEHMKTHVPGISCKRIDTWKTAAPALNALKPGQLSINPETKTVQVGPAKKRKPSRKDWSGIIER